MDKQRLILEAEEQLAREVALGVIVNRPPAAWQLFIPGMFIIDYLRRTAAIRQYTRTFMLPRRVALEVAMAEASAVSEVARRSSIAERMRGGLRSLNLYSVEMVAAQTAVIETLVDHYVGLTNAEGDSLRLILKNAYGNRQRLQAFFDRLTGAEREVDRVLERLHESNSRIVERLAAERQQLALRRAGMLDELF